MSVLARYAKAAAATAVTVATGTVAYLTDGVTPAEWVLIANLAFATVGVTVVPNLDDDAPLLARYAKAATAFLVAGSTVLATVIGGGLTLAEAIEVGVAAFAAVGIVAAVPNAKAGRPAEAPVPPR